jgi:hypothetical protein
MTTSELCVCKRVDSEGGIHTGALCQDCVRMFILDMAYTDPERFEAMVAEARAK